MTEPRKTCHYCDETDLVAHNLCEVHYEAIYRVCSFCESRRVFARGLCLKHYQKAYKEQPNKALYYVTWTEWVPRHNIVAARNLKHAQEIVREGGYKGKRKGQAINKRVEAKALSSQLLTDIHIKSLIGHPKDLTEGGIGPKVPMHESIKEHEL